MFENCWDKVSICNITCHWHWPPVGWTRLTPPWRYPIGFENWRWLVIGWDPYPARRRTSVVPPPAPDLTSPPLKDKTDVRNVLLDKLLPIFVTRLLQYNLKLIINCGNNQPFIVHHSVSYGKTITESLSTLKLWWNCPTNAWLVNKTTCLTSTLRPFQLIQKKIPYVW